MKPGSDKDDISSNGRLVKYGKCCYGQTVRILKKPDFTCFQSVHSCLYVHRHSVTPAFISAVFPNCFPSLQTSKLLFYENMCKFMVHDSIWRHSLVPRPKEGEEEKGPGFSRSHMCLIIQFWPDQFLQSFLELCAQMKLLHSCSCIEQ